MTCKIATSVRDVPPLAICLLV